MNRKIVSVILAAEVILNLCGCSAGAPDLYRTPM